MKYIINCADRCDGNQGALNGKIYPTRAKAQQALKKYIEDRYDQETIKSCINNRFIKKNWVEDGEFANEEESYIIEELEEEE